MTDHTELNRKVALLAGWTLMPVLGKPPIWRRPNRQPDAWRTYDLPPFATDAALRQPLRDYCEERGWVFGCENWPAEYYAEYSGSIGGKVFAATSGERDCLAYVVQREREGE